MKFLDLTLPSAAANLALDEALLDACEEGRIDDEVLRFWESQEYFVVVGYGNKIDVEVDRRACLAEGIPIYRRCSGGGTVLQGPGCLNYNLVLKINEAVQGISQSNIYIMERNRRALENALGKPVTVRGHSDLVLGDLKFSGNAQRRKKQFLVFHGTFLIDFDLPQIQRLLRFPSKEPDYRLGRSHELFITNVHAQRKAIQTALKEVWSAHDRLESVPAINDLVANKYSRPEWNEKF